MWDELIEEIIFNYQRWWKKEWKEKWLRILYLYLRRKYKEPLSKEELDYCKSKGINL